MLICVRVVRLGHNSFIRALVSVSSSRIRIIASISPISIDRSAHVDVILQVQLADRHACILAGDRFASILIRPRQRTFVIVDPVLLQGVGLVHFVVFYKEQNGQEVS